jgi:hypothetical protein
MNQCFPKETLMKWNVLKASFLGVSLRPRGGHILQWSWQDAAFPVKCFLI